MISDHQQGILGVLDLAEDARHRVPRQDDEIHRGHGSIAPVAHPVPHPGLPGGRRRHHDGTGGRGRTIPRFHRHGVQLNRGGPAENLPGLLQHPQPPLGPIHRGEYLLEAGLILRDEQAGDLTATDHRVGGQPQARMGRRSAEESPEHQQFGADLLRPPDDLDAGDPGAKLHPLGIHPRGVRSMHHPEHIQGSTEFGGEAPGDGDRVMPGGRPISGREDLAPCHGWTVGDAS